MTRRIRVAVIGVAAALACTSAPLLGQMRGMSPPPAQPNSMGQMGQMPMGPGMGRGMMNEEMCPMMKMASAPDAGPDTDAQAIAKVFAAVGVTDAQKTQMQAVRDQHQAELKDLKTRAETARLELRQTVQSLAFDEAAVRAKSAALATVVNDAALAELRVRAEAFKVLTPDQQKKAAQIQKLQQELATLLKPAVKKQQ
jgi:Spy/CpxP family protein refolding chaperone